MRFNESMAQPAKPTKEPKQEPVIKAGMKGYDYSNLAGGKKIPTKGGWK